MKSSPFALVLMVALVARSAAADGLDAPEEPAASPWVGGVGLTTTLGSHLMGLGATVVARYGFVQVGATGFTALLGAGGFGTLGVVGTVGKVDLAFEGMFGSQTTNTGPLLDLDLFAECTHDSPAVTATTAGAMLSVSRSLRAGGTWIGGGGWLGGPVRTIRYTTTSTCTSSSWLGDGESTTTTKTTETLGSSGGLFFRVGFTTL